MVVKAACWPPLRGVFGGNGGVVGGRRVRGGREGGAEVPREDCEAVDLVPVGGSGLYQKERGGRGTHIAGGRGA